MLIRTAALLAALSLPACGGQIAPADPDPAPCTGDPAGVYYAVRCVDGRWQAACDDDADCTRIFPGVAGWGCGSKGVCESRPVCTPRSPDPLPFPYYDCGYTNGVWPGPTGGGTYAPAGETWTCPEGSPMPDPLCMRIEGDQVCCPLWARAR